MGGPEVPIRTISMTRATWNRANTTGSSRSTPIEASAPGEASKADALTLDGFTINAGTAPRMTGSRFRGRSRSPSHPTVSCAESAPIPRRCPRSRQLPDEPSGCRRHPAPDLPFQVEILDGGGTVLGRSIVDSGYRRAPCPFRLHASTGFQDPPVSLSWDAVSGAETTGFSARSAALRSRCGKTVSGTSTDDTDAPPAKPLQ